MVSEMYRLTLDHFIDINGARSKLEDPIVVQMVYDRSHAPSVVCLNRMIERMRAEVLKRVTGEE